MSHTSNGLMLTTVNELVTTRLSLDNHNNCDIDPVDHIMQVDWSDITSSHFSLKSHYNLLCVPVGVH